MAKAMKKKTCCVVLVGDQKCGKTSLCKAYLEGSWQKSTLGTTVSINMSARKSKVIALREVVTGIASHCMYLCWYASGICTDSIADDSADVHGEDV